MIHLLLLAGTAYARAGWDADLGEDDLGEAGLYSFATIGEADAFAFGAGLGAGWMGEVAPGIEDVATARGARFRVACQLGHDRLRRTRSFAHRAEAEAMVKGLEAAAGWQEVRVLEIAAPGAADPDGYLAARLADPGLSYPSWLARAEQEEA